MDFQNIVEQDTEMIQYMENLEQMYINIKKLETLLKTESEKNEKLQQQNNELKEKLEQQKDWRHIALKKTEANDKLKEKLEQQEDWEHIAKKKTEALKECFPEYNPAFQCGNDKDMIVSMIKLKSSK